MLFRVCIWSQRVLGLCLHSEQHGHGVSRGLAPTQLRLSSYSKYLITAGPRAQPSPRIDIVFVVHPVWHLETCIYRGTWAFTSSHIPSVFFTLFSVICKPFFSQPSAMEQHTAENSASSMPPKEDEKPSPDLDTEIRPQREAAFQDYLVWPSPYPSLPQQRCPANLVLPSLLACIQVCHKMGLSGLCCWRGCLDRRWHHSTLAKHRLW